jgi:hypothetical protein
VTFSWRPPALTIAYTILAPVHFTLAHPEMGCDRAEAKGTDFIPPGSNWGFSRR